MKYDFQLCNEYKVLPKEYRVEVKLDGTNVICDNGVLFNRDKVNVTGLYPEIKVLSNCVVLGELCIFKNGISDFNSILSRNTTDKLKIKLLSKFKKACLVIYDVLEFEGVSLIDYPLSDRIKYLDKVKGENISVIEVINEVPESALMVARSRSLEGVIVKDLSSVYKSGERNSNFQKLKCFKETTLRVIDFEESGNGFTAIVSNGLINHRVGVNKDDYRKVIKEVLLSKGLVSMEVQYLEVTGNGMLRQPTCRGLRYE